VPLPRSSSPSRLSVLAPFPLPPPLRSSRMPRPRSPIAAGGPALPLPAVSPAPGACGGASPSPCAWPTALPPATCGRPSGAATRRVVLSWPRMDLDKARARVPSFYGLEAVRAATGTLPGFDELRSYAEAGGEARLGWPAPDRPERAIDDSEYDLAVLALLTRE